MPNNPKCNGASSNSIVLVESKRASRKIIEQGIDQNRVIITGNYSDDKIFKLKLQKKSLVAKMKNNHINDNYVLLAAPQLWEHGNVTRDESISIYLNIINELKKLDISVVVSLHPKMDFNFYNDIFKKNAENFVISNYDLHELIICAKCVVCWNISTVSLISLKANIPFIISDFQTGTQSILDDFESRFYSKTKDLSNSINNIISKNVFNNFYKNNKNDYMFGDGKCVNRILDNILE